MTANNNSPPGDIDPAGPTEEEFDDPRGWEDVGRDVLQVLLTQRLADLEAAIEGVETSIATEGEVAPADLRETRQALNVLLWTVEDYVAAVTEGADPYNGPHYDFPTWYHAEVLGVDLADVNDLRARTVNELEDTTEGSE